jgi:uncharacterized protein YgbK (DUF1537 family)
MAHPLYSEIVNSYPPAGTLDFRDEITRMLEKERTRIVVMDDDPTGIQTVQDCLLLTDWEPGTLDKALLHKSPLFYVLINSRSMDESSAVRINREVAMAVLRANERHNLRLIFISRSDSTLRGHFPAEPETILSVHRSMNIPVELPVFFIPSFFEAGRYTAGNVQYVKTGDHMVPAAGTEFAKDSVFGYSHSDLFHYMDEKSGGNIRIGETGTLDLSTLRNSDRDDPVDLRELRELLKSFKRLRYVSVDAMEYADLRKFSLALLQTLSESGTGAILRTSSSLPKALSGIPDRDYLSRKELVRGPGKGLFIIGSHVQKTTRQLGELLKEKGVKGIEADVREIISRPEACLQEITGELEDCRKSGITPVVYTSRQELFTEDREKRLPAGRKIADFLTAVVRSLPAAPAYLVAKGGITSHDILVRGLSVGMAKVAGQVLPGVPVIITGKGDALPSLPYVIFPGNVGDDGSLAELYRKLN